MRVLFVIPKIKSLFGAKGMTVHPHIGVAYLSAFLKKNNVAVDIYDDGITDDIEALYRRIDEFKPSLIGVTVFSYCYDLARGIIKRIQEKTDIPIVAGGAHVSAVGKRILDDAGIPFAVKQEGEYTLRELLREITRAGPDFAAVKGLIWRTGGGRIVENADRELICPLDEIPFPDYDAFGIARYYCYTQRSLPLITSRGCPFGCNYCSVRLSMGQRFRARSAQNVFEEIRHFAGKGWNSFEINDDCFSLDMERAERICDMIIGGGLKIRFQLYNGIRVDTVAPRLLGKMKRAGCFFISYGCEAGNNRILKAIHKGITLDQVRRAVEWTNAAGIANSVNFIIGHKEETYADALETLAFARSLPTQFVNFYNLVPYPGTESFEWAHTHARFLVDPDSFLENISYRDNKPIFETKEFTARQREKITAAGFEIYRKRILTWRLGRVPGTLAYLATKPRWINGAATRFALGTHAGKAVYGFLSRKSWDRE